MISRKLVALLLYILCIILIFLLKPSMMFDENGNIKQFGYECESSLLSLIILSPFIAIFCYFIIIIIEMIVS